MNSKIVVIVDMQHDFINGALGTPEARSMMPRFIQQIKDDPADTYYIFTRDTHDDNYLNTMEGKYLPIKHCIINDYGWDIYSEFYDVFSNKPYIINKPTFGSLELMRFIREVFEDGRNTFEIEFRGVCTDICVIANALLAKTYFPEVPISVNSKLCAGSTPEMHEAALKVMKSCQIEIM
jgi:nicotinamidase-related amidase